ncbi:MAG: GYD domain-containing protein [Proteobacteria bacterium]|nr:GYD domain-containing protein [Pseudomonadota bacterium]
MAKFMVEASYSPEGVQGLMKEGAASRATALKKAAASLGGKLDAIYWVLGERDALVIVDFPDAVSAAGFAIAVSSTHFAETRTTCLLTAAEIDEAVKKKVAYRAPGK